MKPFILFTAFLLITLAGFSQSRTTYVDGLKVTAEVAKALSMNDIVGMRMTEDGAYYTTRTAACNTYWNYFKAKSPRYAQLVPTLQEIYKVQYVINNTVLAHDFDATLAGISDANFISMQVVDQATLSKDYGIADKPYGVILKTKSMASRARP